MLLEHVKERIYKKGKEKRISKKGKNGGRTGKEKNYSYKRNVKLSELLKYSKNLNS